MWVARAGLKEAMGIMELPIIFFCLPPTPLFAIADHAGVLFSTGWGVVLYYCRVCWVLAVECYVLLYCWSVVGCCVGGSNGMVVVRARACACGCLCARVCVRACMCVRTCVCAHVWLLFGCRWCLATSAGVSLSCWGVIWYCLGIVECF